MHPLLWFGFKSLPFLQRIVLRSLFIWKSVPTLCICSNPNFSQSLADACERAKSLQLCPTLCDSMDYSPPGFSVHGILQARILEWVFCRALLQGIFPTQGSNPHLLSPALSDRFFTLALPGSPISSGQNTVEKRETGSNFIKLPSWVCLFLYNQP